MLYDVTIRAKIESEFSEEGVKNILMGALDGLIAEREDGDAVQSYEIEVNMP